MFEGDYHYGVAAFVNSLHAHGFRGTVWAGYRGQLPPWARPVISEGSTSRYQVANGLDIRFLPLTTESHLTNFKPDFMLNICENHCPSAEALFYFDPDIVIRCQWSYFEAWAKFGIALCEDINSPLSQTHPLRFQWNEIYSQHGHPLRFTSNQYINGGFQGIARPYKEFLNEWCLAQQIMSKEIGSLSQITAHIGGRAHPFSKTDQDALNVALAMTRQPLSIIGKEGMDIESGGFTMSHAIGHLKPWNTSFLSEALRGHPPSMACKSYFSYVQSPIGAYSASKLKRARLSLKLASALGRFYRGA
jgi:hypothetical protein